MAEESTWDEGKLSRYTSIKRLVREVKKNRTSRGIIHHYDTRLNSQ